jgi:hypothetical protein
LKIITLYRNFATLQIRRGNKNFNLVIEKSPLERAGFFYCCKN